ncbi:MAG TPA: DUF4398 domain-containing protein [Vicinamibacteria bacterium]|nr:DUF4398 domain-containing protein [Vicinamibacteria bacterium]
MRLHARWAVLIVLPAVACASAGAKSPAGPGRLVDLKAARAAVEEARRAGAPQRAAETFRRAESHLKEAEGLAGRGTVTVAADKAQQAEFLGRLATAEARCATNLARLPPAAPADKTARGGDEAAARLRRADEERRRLEERVALLQRELELTEMEVVRTKARLQGIETKAEASSAIAEARILMTRLAARDRATLSRCQELLDKAEQQISENNFGAAVFFARKAQDIATKAREPIGGTQP